MSACYEAVGIGDYCRGAESEALIDWLADSCSRKIQITARQFSFELQEVPVLLKTLNKLQSQVRILQITQTQINMAQEREKLILTTEEAQSIVWGDSSEYEVIEDTIESTSRWSENHSIVIKRLSDGKFFADGYSQGLTEMQDESPYEYSEPDFTEVFQVEKTIIAYE